MPPETLDYAPRKEFDTGLFVARYLQVLAWISIAGMIAGPIFFHSFHIDLSFILLFWVADALRQHSPRARLWTLVVFGLALMILSLALLKAAVFGTTGMTLSLGRQRVEDPPLWQFTVCIVPILVIVGVPFLVLLSSRARR